MKPRLSAFNAKRKIKEVVQDKYGRTSEAIITAYLTIRYNASFPSNHKMLR